MDLSTALYLAMRALWRNKTRAFLTTLGVIIGVGSVIAMVSIGAGAQQKIAAQLASMGTNSLVIRPGSSRRGGVRTGAGTTVALKMTDVRAIEEIIGVTAVSPTVRSFAQLRYRGTNWGSSVEGVTTDYFKVKNWAVTEGELFTPKQIASASNVCLLGQTAAKELFGLSSPVGELILVKGIACRVIGVMESKGANAWGQDQDDTVLMPLATVQRKIMGITHVDNIEVDTLGRDTTYTVMTQLTNLLRRLHRIQAGQPDDFRIYNRAELAKTSEESARIFTWLLGSIASVSLLVGGIGIMNIMLVSVTERTREIGIRMALGARRRDVLWQFMLEALMLSAAGGLIGVVLGLGGAVIISHLSKFPISITAWSVLVAFSFAVLIGVFFGLHPARKASRFHPIEALRYE